MPEWCAALICIAIVIAAIIVTSIVKAIIKHVTTRNGNEFDAKKYEYLFAAISLLISAAGVFCFLRFALKITDVNILIKNTALYAGSVQTVYVFVAQLFRKGLKGIISGIISLIAFVKSSKNPVESLPEHIKTETKTTETSDSSDIEKLKDEFAKIISKTNNDEGK